MLGSGNSSYSWVALYSSSHTLPYLAASPIPRWPPLQDGTLHQHGGGAAAPTAGGVAVGVNVLEAADAALKCRARADMPDGFVLGRRPRSEPAGLLISSRALQGVPGACLITIVWTDNASAGRGACERGARAPFRSFSGGFQLAAACWIVLR